MRKNDTVTMSRAEADSLRLFAAAGKELLADIRAEVARIGRILGDEAAAVYAAERADTLDELRRLRDIYRERWDRHLPPSGRAAVAVEQKRSAALFGDPRAAKVLSGMGVTPEMLEKFGGDRNG